MPIDADAYLNKQYRDADAPATKIAMVLILVSSNIPDLAAKESITIDLV